MIDIKEAIASSLQARILPERKSSIYQIGLLLVALAMALLPCLYVLLIVVSAYGLYIYVNDPSMIQALLSALSYIGMNEQSQKTYLLIPILLFSIQIVFMTLPIVSSVLRFLISIFLRIEPKTLHTLNPRDEPLLYFFVEQICRSINAPLPKRIDLITEPNAYASFRKGIFSIFRGGDLVLTLGLPLISTLSVQQLGGVIAHELGHFTQTAGMRLAYVIQSINGWFARVVYERGTYETWLRSPVKDNWLWWIIKSISLVFIWITRVILWVYMMLGRIISSFMSRQMEFDADRFEIRIAGSSAFESTAFALRVLQIAYHDVYLMLIATWTHKVLVDNLMDLIRIRASAISSHTFEKVIQDVFSEDKSNILDTHPSDKTRIIRARNSNEEGLLFLDNPCEVLFPSLDIYSKMVTKRFYQELFGATKDIKLLPADVYINHYRLNEQEYEAYLARSFIG